MTIHVGIDPGLSGAIAFLDAAGEPVGIGIADTPVLTVSRSTGGKRSIMDLPGCRELLLSVAPASSLRVVLEQVGPMPGQGVTSMFRFGEGYGAWQGLLAALQIPHQLVHPQRWQRAMLDGVPRGDGASLLVARRRWPGIDLHRKKDHGRADALLLAEYGRTRAWAALEAGAA